MKTITPIQSLILTIFNQILEEMTFIHGEYAAEPFTLTQPKIVSVEFTSEKNGKFYLSVEASFLQTIFLAVFPDGDITNITLQEDLFKELTQSITGALIHQLFPEHAYMMHEIKFEDQIPDQTTEFIPFVTDDGHKGQINLIFNKKRFK